MSIDSDLIRGHVDTIILKTLADGDKYGYEIIKEIETKSNGTYELKQPTLYSCLKRLEGQGFISAYWVNSEIGGRRHYYKLTEQGRKEYTTNMNEWLSSRGIIDNLISNEIPAYENKDYNLSSPSATAFTTESTENTTTVNETTSLTQPNNNETTSAPNNEDTNILKDFTNSLPEIKTVEAKSEEPATKVEDLDGINIGEKTQRADTKFNIRDFKSNGASFFNSVKDIEHNENLTEEQELSTQPNYFSANTFDGILNENTDEQTTTTPPYTTENNQPENENFENYSSYTSFNQTDAEPEESTDYTSQNSFDNNFSSADEGSSYNDYSSNEDSGEDYSQSLNFGEDTSSNINDLSYWNKGFTIKDNNDEFNYDYDREPEISDSTELAIKDQYDSPTVKPDMPLAESDNYNYNDENLDDTYYNPYGKDENATANLFTDNKRKFTPQFTDNESKTLLNTLSSYGSTSFEQATPSEKLQESSSSFETLEDDLGKKGIIVTEYVRRPKEPVSVKNYIWSNKIKCVSSLITYGITMILLITGFLLAKSFNFVDFNYLSTALPAGFYFWLFALLLTVAPATYTTIFCLNKTKKAKAKFNFKIAIIFSLLFFIQALVIIYAVNIPFGLYSFSQKDYNHYMWLLPAICTTYIPLQTIIYELLYKSKKFHA